MEDDPISLSADLARNIGVFRDRFGASGNADIIIRRFRSGAFISALMTIDGMTDTREIDEKHPQAVHGPAAQRRRGCAGGKPCRLSD